MSRGFRFANHPPRTADLYTSKNSSKQNVAWKILTEYEGMLAWEQFCCLGATMQTSLARMFSLALCFTCSLAASLAWALPVTLTGAWEDSYQEEHGMVTVSITKKSGAEIEGVVQLTGSRNCVQPIPFRGTVSEKTIVLVADTPGICGYNGTLNIEAAVGSPESPGAPQYSGTFTYRFLGMTWKKGTFRLKLRSEETQRSPHDMRGDFF